MAFEERHPEAYTAMALAMKEYSKYVIDLEVEDGSGCTPAPMAGRQKKSAITLEQNPQGFPILPETEDEDTEDDLEYQKRLIRAFLTDHYSKQ